MYLPRMEDTKNAFVTSAGKPHGERTVGRLRSGWYTIS